MEPIKFKEFSPHIDVSFWYELERLKLHEWKLKEPTVQLRTYIPSATRLKHHIPNIVTISRDSFNLEQHPASTALIDTTFKNFNTQEQLRDLDKKKALHEAGEEVMARINRGQWDTESLTTALMYTYADLKNHKFSYILAFPAIDLGSAVRCRKLEPATDYYSKEQLQAVYMHATELATGAIGSRPFVVIQKDKDTAVEILPFTPQNVLIEDCAIAFTDSSPLAEYPGWHLRNLIAAIRTKNPDTTSMNFLCVRDTAEGILSAMCSCDPLPEDPLLRPVVRTHGWVESKVRVVDLQAMMDPSKLAESSARLNLSLMKWRMMPDINLEGMMGCRALLLGAGTLGCNLARHLMMWGCSKMTFVDRGQVSYSNPVRQSLFELKDVLAEGDRSKAVAAAASIKRILPTVDAQGVNLTIRMPGHRVDEEDTEQAIKDILDLEELIKDHDVVFLGVDSREARWLPTLLATVHEKPIFNVALGFDSWVIMRHGLRGQTPRLGCYFCNDVVAPMDSITSRSIDQQCTVTRPGVSAISSAIAVELLASCYNHPDGMLVGAWQENAAEDNPVGETLLGIVPHTLRGNVTDYGVTPMHGPAYTKCTACSDTMVELYQREGASFLLQCINTPDFMEEVTGLKAERAALADAQEDLDWDMPVKEKKAPAPVEEAAAPHENGTAAPAEESAPAEAEAAPVAEAEAPAAAEEVTAEA